MQKLKLVSVTMIVLVSGMLLIGCTRRDETSVSTAPKLTNSDLETKIKAKLTDDPDLRAADVSVNADLADNKVTLKGTVETEAQRMRAVEAAKSSHSGIVVEDRIDVKPRELTRADYTAERANEERTRARDVGDRIGDSLDDAWVHSKIVAKLIGNTVTPERKINVDVDNGVVTLRGTVDTAEARTEAERVAVETDGVKRVNNQLKVSKTTRG
jgi:osmotically-inducible protein OsmY